MSDSAGGISTGATVIGIKAETSVADPDSCKFTVDRVVHPGGPFAYRHIDPTTDAPLVARLFGLGQVTHVLIAGPTVTVSKSTAASWDPLRREIGAAIREHLTAGSPAIIDSGTLGVSGRSERQVRVAIEDLLTRTVNPSIASHGGTITVVDLTDGVLSIEMSGGCQGCSSSTATLRDGFETMARLAAPEITEIIDTTDHASGTAPFHPPGLSPATSTSPIAMTRSPNHRSHTP
ncbi:MAG: Fe-S cluster biogenesis protein NfuA [Ilumatobacter sp.]|jgi:Fe-S cluster biogenesis protein NfuA